MRELSEQGLNNHEYKLVGGSSSEDEHVVPKGEEQMPALRLQSTMWVFLDKDDSQITWKGS